MQKEVEIELCVIGESIDDVKEALERIVGDRDDVHVCNEKIETYGAGFTISADLIVTP